MEKVPFNAIYESYVVQSSAAYRSNIGEPVNLDPEAFSDLLVRLRDYRTLYPGMAFWLIIEYKTLSITDSDGDVDVFGCKLTSVKDYFQTMHPDYIIPYLRWRGAAYELIFRENIKIEPLMVGYQQSVPLKTKDGQHFWFTKHSSIAQIDAEGRIVTNLQTFYWENKWSARNLRPFEASVIIRDSGGLDLEHRLISHLSLMLIDEFTNAELDLLEAYAAGRSVDEIMEIKSWSRHTLHEYNANLLRKAKNLFVYDFRNARDFAEYCLEKGFIRLR